MAEEDDASSFRKRMWGHKILVLSLTLATQCGYVCSSVNLDLPSEFLPYYFNLYPVIAKQCEKDPECPYKVSQNINEAS